ncbi:hypothetical protein CN984_26260 [Bacillus cereus]|uniref:Uncharacterized protein n=1 Tax=Bacillus cereus TaxID=1396 RepID=A0A2B9PJ05_BACCE|nr:hypothetical protein CN984_26260 [Bacillus cereus]
MPFQFFYVSHKYYSKGYKLSFHEERMKGILKNSHFICGKNREIFICMLYNKGGIFGIYIYKKGYMQEELNEC